jgi:septal ring factor EnvC (AmiA/AmiB activator)
MPWTLARAEVAGMTNSERIEANTTAVQSVERTMAVHEQQIKSLEGDVNRLKDGYLSTRELLARMDERLKHVERSVDRIWKLLLTLVAAAVIEVVRRVVESL